MSAWTESPPRWHRARRYCVHGDYDVDGVTSTALLVRTLRALEGRRRFSSAAPAAGRATASSLRPSTRRPRRARALSLPATAASRRYDTVRARAELGIDVVITDHHEPGAELPQAIAVINPKRADADYPFPELAGVGVAFKFAQGLVRKLGHDEESFKARFIDLAALGTVGDVVPLLGENRAIVKHGLDAISAEQEARPADDAALGRPVGKPLTSYYARVSSLGRGSTPSAGWTTPPLRCGCFSPRTRPRRGACRARWNGTTPSARRSRSGSSREAMEQVGVQGPGQRAGAGACRARAGTRRGRHRGGQDMRDVTAARRS